MKKTLVCLHGFLGHPRDWDFLKEWDINLECPYLFTKDWDFNFQNWGQRLILFLKQKKIKDPFLIAYSMGGRLALHALEADPDYWQEAVLVSCHWGFKDFEEKSQKAFQEKEWILDLENLSMSEFILKWEQQEIFRNSPQIFRNPLDYNKKYLIKSLKQWSLSQQKNFLNSKDLPFSKIHYWVGEQDLKYRAHMQDIQSLKPEISFKIFKNSGHRLIWEAHQNFKEEIKIWLQV